MAETELRVAIIGAGMGGLSLGLALRERGLTARVYEQAPELTEIGAAIALSANSLREFDRLGLLDELAAESTIPTELIYRHWRDGSRISSHPVRKDNAYVSRFGAPYFGIHRADIQTILSRAFGVENLHLGCRIVNIVDETDPVVLEFANGRVGHADIVVGADGVRSTVRRWVTGADDSVYSGTSAFRGIVPTDNLPSLPDPHAIQFWMGPDAHLLHHAIGGNGESVNFFAVVDTARIWLHEGTTVEVHQDVPVASFRGWHPAVTEMIRAAESPIRWALFTVRPLLRWYRGRVVILGDAAHGMLPHHGQGANTSIEDAFALAALLAESGRYELETTFPATRPCAVPRPLRPLFDGSTACKKFGRIDILINNVGGTIWAKPYAYYEENEIEAEIRRSLFPTMWCCRAVLPFMIKRKRGTIVNVSSVATRGVNRVPYAAAKGGLTHSPPSLAFEYAGQGIRVVAIAPGGIEAPPRRIPRGATTKKTKRERDWYQAIVDQTVESSLIHQVRNPGRGGGAHPVPCLGRGVLHHRYEAASCRR
jgi:2-polyprenyl-6-methoxyphenol hydroxylase-like FAD-dependent oxidoreductase